MDGSASTCLGHVMVYDSEVIAVLDRAAIMGLTKREVSGCGGVFVVLLQ
jgi:hypothetical protein